jgi:hypothetical protein
MPSFAGESAATSLVGTNLERGGSGALRLTTQKIVELLR